MSSSPNSQISSSGLKSIFKKPTNFNAVYEVSLNESTTGSQINRTDLDQDTASGSDIFRPFEKQRKSVQGFNVNAEESYVNGENEQSGMLFNPKSLFAKKQTVDSFNVTFNASSSNPNLITNLSEESVLVKKTNPFRQINKENEISIRDEESEQIGADSTTWMTKQNPFEKRKQSQNISDFSFTEQRTCESSQRSKLALADKEAANLSINVSRAHSGSYMDTSSINDENLNNWMSDQSEDEIVVPPVVPPVVTPVTKNLSLTKEKQNVSGVKKSPPRTNWEEKLNSIISKAQEQRDGPAPTPQKQKPKKIVPTENESQKYRPKKLIKPSSFATKGLYEFILKKFKLKYGIDAIVEAEDMVLCICDTVKKVLRRKAHQKALIQSLKKKMAKAELIETTTDFYEFVIKYLPYDFRVKVVPCLQPITNIVYPPKDLKNPFDKIL